MEMKEFNVKEIAEALREAMETECDNTVLSTGQDEISANAMVEYDDYTFGIEFTAYVTCEIEYVPDRNDVPCVYGTDRHYSFTIDNCIITDKDDEEYKNEALIDEITKLIEK